MATIRHKRGDTFSRDCQLLESTAGPPVDITGWTIASMIRARGGDLISELTVAITNPMTGSYRLTDTNTGDWPLGDAAMDIQYTDAGGAVHSSDTVLLRILADITRP
jgi:hypothetical protein